MPHCDAALPRARGEHDGGGAGQGAAGKGDGKGAGEATGPQCRCPSGVHRWQARRLHGQGHVAPPQRQPRPSAAQCGGTLGLASCLYYALRESRSATRSAS